MTQETYRELLLTQLDRSAELRARFVEDAAFGERRVLLRAWQEARSRARTHRDLLESRRFHAAEFFLTDLYGPRDLSRHIEEVRRIVPVMNERPPGFRLGDGRARHGAQRLVRELYEEAARCKPADAMQKLDAEHAREEADG